MANRAQELYCHGCDGYVRFVIDESLDGNHVLNCPNCGHEHCRVVRHGHITDIRWDSRNGPTYFASSVAYFNVSMDSTCTASSIFLTQMWAGTGATS